jgi:hypothetical protein
MAILPNDDFTAGQVLTASEQNRFPRGIMAYATSTTTYTLTLTETITTGMTVTFTAVAGRLYKLTYYEPLVNTPSVASGQTNLQLRLTNATGTQLQRGIIRTNSSTPVVGSVGTFDLYAAGASGSVTIVGTSFASSLTGAPDIDRNIGAPAFISVEDIGIF